MKFLSFLVVLLSLCCFIYGQSFQHFSATVRAFVPNGRGAAPQYMAMNGLISYSYSTNKQQKITWDISKYYGANAKVYNYVRQVTLSGNNLQDIAYSVCPFSNKCTAQTISVEGRPQLFKDTRHSSSSSYSSESLGVSTCPYCWTDPASGSSIVKTKTVCTADAGGTGNACYARFYDGTVYLLSNFGAYQAFGAPPESGVTGVSSCPAPVCSPDLDMLFVVDNSGSLDSNEYGSLESFCNNVVDSFTLYSTSTGRGLRAAVLQFGDGFSVYDFSYSRSVIRSNLQRKDIGDWTATGTAMQKANQMWSGQIANPRQGVSRVQIVLTDGYCNDNCGVIVAQSNTCRNTYLVNLIGIGVGTAVNTDEIKKIACGCTGSCTCPARGAFYKVDQFSALQGLLSSIVQVNCGELTSSCSCSNSFCACEKCICPSDCHGGGNRCMGATCNKFTTIDSCSYASNASLCITNACRVQGCDTNAPVNVANPCTDSGAVNCNDGNACTSDLCNTVSGCYHTDNSNAYCATTPSPPNACNTVTCASGTCTQHPISGCDNCRLPCGCTSGVNCNPDPVDCSSLNNFPNCKVGYCDPSVPCDNSPTPNTLLVCKAKDIVCPHVDCYVGTCNTTSPTGTCGYSPKNCNDNNKCTDDICAGDVCSNPLKNITNFCNDGNPCTIDLCDPAGGCYHQPKDCSMFDNACQHGVCNELNGQCFNSTIDCGADLARRGITVGECHEIKCSLTPRIGNKVVDGKVLENQVLDPGCYTSYIEVKDASTCATVIVNGTETLDCSNAKVITEDACGVCGGNGKSCGLGVAAIAGIAAGVLAAIIIAVIIAVAILGSIAGKVGMDYYRKYKGNMGASHANPLYDGKEGEHQNPFYEDDAVPMSKK